VAYSGCLSWAERAGGGQDGRRPLYVVPVAGMAVLLPWHPALGHPLVHRVTAYFVDLLAAATGLATREACIEKTEKGALYDDNRCATSAGLARRV
jgi:hypothetical protein